MLFGQGQNQIANKLWCRQCSVWSPSPLSQTMAGMYSGSSLIKKRLELFKPNVSTHSAQKHQKLSKLLVHNLLITKTKASARNDKKYQFLAEDGNGSQPGIMPPRRCLYCTRNQRTEQACTLKAVASMSTRFTAKHAMTCSKDLAQKSSDVQAQQRARQPLLT